MDSPTFRFLGATTTPAVDGLDAPPGPKEGEITGVEFDRVRGTALDRDRQACQACGEPVQMGEPHVRATVWVDNAISQIKKNPVFCDQSCWASWAGATDP